MTTEERIYLYLYHYPDDWSTRLILADWYEEQGKVFQAHTQRWMVAHHKRSFYRSSTTVEKKPPVVGQYKWTWLDNVWKWYGPSYKPNGNYTIPDNLFHHMASLEFTYIGSPDMYDLTFKTLKEADLALALALEAVG